MDLGFDDDNETAKATIALEKISLNKEPSIIVAYANDKGDWADFNERPLPWYDLHYSWLMPKPTDEFTDSIETLGLDNFETRKLCVAVTTLGHTMTPAKQDLANSAIVELTGNMPTQTFRDKIGPTWWLVKMPTARDAARLVKAGYVVVKPNHRISQVVFFRQPTIVNRPFHLISARHLAGEANNVRDSLNERNHVVTVVIRRTVKIKDGEQTSFIVTLDSHDLKLHRMKTEIINTNKVHFSIPYADNCQYCHSEDTHQAPRCPWKSLQNEFNVAKWTHDLGDDVEAYRK